ncbi:MAG: bifunctional riboflavin kinase/FAD synthetase [Anaerolineales bacterium]
MQHFYDLTDIQLEKSFVSIGSFDGVHLGHQQIIQDLVEKAGQAKIPTAVITFHPHPQLIIHDEKRPYYITMPEQRAALLGQMGIDFVLTYPFDKDTSSLPAEEFVTTLQERFHFSELWIGYDFALGKNREGNSNRLKEIGGKLSFEVHEIPAFKHQGEIVSSSGIRKKIRVGDVKSAASLLGRPFEIRGKVVKGDNRGKSLGFATSNLSVSPEMVDIKPGVYACQAEIQGEILKAVTNIGFRPTFWEGVKSALIEAHILDFSRDIYGQQLGLRFYDRLRDEKKFDQVNDLIHQIKVDIDLARSILED